MSINKIYKICILSDTHFKLKKDAKNALLGNFCNNQIYESKLNIDSFNTDDNPNFQKDIEKISHNKPNLIIHAGDIGDQDIINYCQSICNTVAVMGNCDFCRFNTSYGKTKDFELIDFEGVIIAIAHIPSMLDYYIHTDLSKKFNKSYSLEDIDLKIHGHTHVSDIDFSKEPFTICPGSATLGRGGTPDSIANVYIYNKKIIRADLIQI